MRNAMRNRSVKRQLYCTCHVTIQCRVVSIEFHAAFLCDGDGTGPKIATVLGNRRCGPATTALLTNLDATLSTGESRRF
eukprot:8717603-Prorocentrum_lima.AAC.1